jgi:hypothetical protein
MRWHISERIVYRARATVGVLVVVVLLSIGRNVCRAEDGGDAPPQMPLHSEIRSGGVLEESYAYHRQPPARVAGAAKIVVPASGWYGYGFPVSTFRWGWFGAAHYYPTHFWHDGYYGDCCRYGYRRGY